MDSQTHIEFADKLLAIAQRNRAYAVASLFPQIDRHPHVFHRMYAHTVFKAVRLVDTGLGALGGERRQGTIDYEVRRFEEEKARFQAYMKANSWTLPVADPDAFQSALLAFVSHLYLDTFNQPTQPFAPMSIYCAGQWSLWERIGDFRLTLYTTTVIDQLRRDLFSHRFWRTSDSFPVAALIQAMLHRLCRLSLERIGEGVVAPAMRAMKLGAQSGAQLARACEFLAEFEAVLIDLHVRHLLAEDAAVGSAAARENKGKRLAELAG